MLVDTFIMLMSNIKVKQGRCMSKRCSFVNDVNDFAGSNNGF